MSSGKDQNRPSNDVVSFSHTRRRMVSASSMRAPRWENFDPCTWYSSGHQPMPTPSEMRPPES